MRYHGFIRLLLAAILCSPAINVSGQVDSTKNGGHEIKHLTDTVVNFSDAIALKPGHVYVLRNVVFVMDRHRMKRASRAELNHLVSILKTNPKMKIAIEGHVCCIQHALDALDLDNNEPKLSLNRAQAVYQYLVKKGIDATRLTYIGVGRTRPIIQNELTYADAAINRRVEMRVLEN